MNTYNELVNCQRMFRNAVLNCDDFAKKKCDELYSFKISGYH